MLRKLLQCIGLQPAQYIILLGDFIALQIVLMIAMCIRSFWGDVPLHLYATMGLLLCFAPLFSLLLGSCEIPAPPPHREVKQTFLAVSMTFLAVLLTLFITQKSMDYSRTILILAWGGSIFTVPTLRGLLRRRCCRYSWWGRPVFFLQDKTLCKELWEELTTYPERGLRPIKYMHINFEDDSWQQQIAEIKKHYIQPLFLWCTTHEKHSKGTRFLQILSRECIHLLLIPQSDSLKEKLWFAPRFLGTSTAFLVRQNLQDKRRLRVKYCMDYGIAVVVFCLILPLAFLIALCIRLDSKGHIFYTQERFGQDGKKIRIIKFRTMVQDADAVLTRYLQDNPAIKEEWETQTKLQHDPRITRIGKILRRTSLDELPQIFNVLLGDMSLVGPRPILLEEKEQYGNTWWDYIKVKPGITGLWQISGRNNTSYQQRLWYVQYYVTNWSIWMDLWILARTIPVVLRGSGAY